jgi:hypothetical protein
MTDSRYYTVDSRPWVARLLQELGGHRDSSETERKSSRFSSMTSLGGGAVKIATLRCSIETAGGVPMGSE